MRNQILRQLQKVKFNIDDEQDQISLLSHKNLSLKYKLEQVELSIPIDAVSYRVDPKIATTKIDNTIKALIHLREANEAFSIFTFEYIGEKKDVLDLKTQTELWQLAHCISEKPFFHYTHKVHALLCHLYDDMSNQWFSIGNKKTVIKEIIFNIVKAYHCILGKYIAVSIKEDEDSETHLLKLKSFKNLMRGTCSYQLVENSKNCLIQFKQLVGQLKINHIQLLAMQEKLKYRLWLEKAYRLVFNRKLVIELHHALKELKKQVDDYDTLINKDPGFNQLWFVNDEIENNVIVPSILKPRKMVYSNYKKNDDMLKHYQKKFSEIKAYHEFLTDSLIKMEKRRQQINIEIQRIVIYKKILNLIDENNKKILAMIQKPGTMQPHYFEILNTVCAALEQHCGGSDFQTFVDAISDKYAKIKEVLLQSFTLLNVRLSELDNTAIKNYMEYDKKISIASSNRSQVDIFIMSVCKRLKSYKLSGGFKRKQLEVLLIAFKKDYDKNFNDYIDKDVHFILNKKYIIKKYPYLFFSNGSRKCTIARVLKRHRYPQNPVSYLLGKKRSNTASIDAALKVKLVKETLCF